MQDNPLVRWNIVNVEIQITFGCNVDWTLDFITKLGWQVKIKSTPEGDESSLWVSSFISWCKLNCGVNESICDPQKKTN